MAPILTGSSEDVPVQAATCAVCGAAIAYEPPHIHREMPICGICGSVPRFCGIALAASRAIWGGPDRPLSERPRRGDIKAIGMSDDPRLAVPFAEKFDYTNTEFDREPRLDLCSAESCRQYSADLIVCSDVLEHTFDPPAVPLANLFTMLKPGGTLILSAPTTLRPATIEWYGGAESLAVEPHDGRFQVRWRNRRGTEYLDTQPVFHAGPGAVLEMRLISHPELLATARAAGFAGGDMAFAPEWGYFWPFPPMSPPVPEAADARIIVLTRPRDR
jgi:SAM-dependent methyltransferase